MAARASDSPSRRAKLPVLRRQQRPEKTHSRRGNWRRTCDGRSASGTRMRSIPAACRRVIGWRGNRAGVSSARRPRAPFADYAITRCWPYYSAAACDASRCWPWNSNRFSNAKRTGSSRTCWARLATSARRDTPLRQGQPW